MSPQRYSPFLSTEPANLDRRRPARSLFDLFAPVAG
jgi:hypothetical protein